MIFQDPYSSLDPRMNVAEIVSEPLIYQGMKASERHARAAELIRQVGLMPDHLRRYPHEFSGGQRQRIGIARALAASPQFIVCDEPISALDVSIQAQVINMLEDLQSELGLTFLFVSHDLTMVRHISHTVGVMYLGKMVEEAEVDDLFRNTSHPYTQALFSAAPVADPDEAAKRQRIILEGDVPTPIDTPPGCPFQQRCPHAFKLCREEAPELKQIAPGHSCACHLIA